VKKVFALNASKKGISPTTVISQREDAFIAGKLTITRHYVSENLEKQKKDKSKTKALVPRLHRKKLSEL